MTRSAPVVATVLAALLLAACATGPSGPSAGQGSAEEHAPVATEPDEALTVDVLTITPAPPSDGDVICRRESVTGTHQKREICATRAERRAQRRDAQEWHRSGGLRGGVAAVPTVR